MEGVAQIPPAVAPKLIAPTLTREQQNHREAVTLFALGMRHERQNRLLTALELLEKAARLDPEATAPYEALIPLYVAMERPADALAMCQKILKLDADNLRIWFLLARLHRTQGERGRALEALQQGLARPNLDADPEMHLRIASDLGELYEEMADLDSALAAYNRVAKLLDEPTPFIEKGVFTRTEIASRSARLHEHLAKLYLQQKRYESAASALKKAQQKDPQSARRLNLHLARIRQAQKKPKEALEHIDAYLLLQPQEMEAYELKIALLKELNRNEQILPALRHYVQLDPYNISLKKLLADQLVQHEQWSEAESLYKTIAKEVPRIDVYASLLMLYQKRGRMDQVLQELDAALVKADPAGGPAGDAMAAAQARAMLNVLRDRRDLSEALVPIAERELGNKERHHNTWRYLGLLAARAALWTSAEKFYRRCFRKIDDFDQRGQAELYLGLLEVLWEQRKYEEVIEWSRRGLKQNQLLNRLLFHDYLIRAWAQLDEIEKALSETETALRFADADNRLYLLRRKATLLALDGKFDDAVKVCEKLLKEYKGAKQERDIRYTLSGVYTTAKLHDQAEEQLRLILKFDPNDDTANNDLGYLMADRGKNLEEAERLIRKAIDLDRAQRRVPGEEQKHSSLETQDKAAYIDSLGWVLFKRGKYEEALHHLQRAVRLPHGNDPTLWDHLGDVYDRLGRKQEARSAWLKALRLYEKEKRRMQDDHYRQLKVKLQFQSTERK